MSKHKIFFLTCKIRAPKNHEPPTHRLSKTLAKTVANQTQATVKGLLLINIKEKKK